MASGVSAKLLKGKKFPPEFDKKVDITKINMDVINKYALHTRRVVSFPQLTFWQLGDWQDQ